MTATASVTTAATAAIIRRGTRSSATPTKAARSLIIPWRFRTPRRLVSGRLIALRTLLHDGRADPHRLAAWAAIPKVLPRVIVLRRASRFGPIILKSLRRCALKRPRRLRGSSRSRTAAMDRLTEPVPAVRLRSAAVRASPWRRIAPEIPGPAGTTEPAGVS